MLRVRQENVTRNQATKNTVLLLRSLLYRLGAVADNILAVVVDSIPVVVAVVDT